MYFFGPSSSSCSSVSFEEDQDKGDGNDGSRGISTLFLVQEGQETSTGHHHQWTEGLLGKEVVD